MTRFNAFFNRSSCEVHSALFYAKKIAAEQGRSDFFEKLHGNRYPPGTALHEVWQKAFDSAAGTVLRAGNDPQSN